MLNLTSVEQEAVTQQLEQANNVVLFVSSALAYWDQDSELSAPEREAVGFLLYQSHTAINEAMAKLTASN